MKFRPSWKKPEHLTGCLRKTDPFPIFTFFQGAFSFRLNLILVTGSPRNSCTSSGSEVSIALTCSFRSGLPEFTAFP
jgi:hypothetical protein